jgi:hypothetical protein
MCGLHLGSHRHGRNPLPRVRDIETRGRHLRQCEMQARLPAPCTLQLAGWPICVGNTLGSADRGRDPSGTTIAKGGEDELNNMMNDEVDPAIPRAPAHRWMRAASHHG